MEYMRRTWVEVSLDNLEHNYHMLRGMLPEQCKFLGIVKADAYGHGAVAVGRKLERLGADYLAVSEMEEAVQLRRGGITVPVLILGYTPPEFAGAMAKYNFTQEINSLEYAQALSCALQGTGLTLKAHIKLDTGMSRLGFFAYDRPETLDEIVSISKLPQLDLEGVFAHFSVADSRKEADVAYTRLQFQRFMDTLDALQARGVTFRIRHHANSAAILQYPEFALDMVRAGIACYGIFPSGDLRGCADLRPTFSLLSSIAQIKSFPAGIPVSYDRIYTTPSPRSIAVLPVGYADGFLRRLSVGTTVLLHGRRVPVVGRICMDLCMIDVTDVPEAAVGDTVTILGTDGDETVRCYELAERVGTIPYEIICGISKRVPRLYMEGGKQIDLLRYIV
ncbi:MAG: alanine racemase [Oscillospiraceae bacterium]|nr:alanine racemase [Oscillospiraceae bacterium]